MFDEEGFKALYEMKWGHLGIMLGELEISKKEPNANRDEEFIWQLKSAVENIDAICEVYLRDKDIYPSYALEKLDYIKRTLDNSIEYFKLRARKMEEEENE